MPSAPSQNFVSAVCSSRSWIHNMIDSGSIISIKFCIQSRCLFGGLSEICPLFFPDRQFSHLNPLTGSTSEKFQNYFFKISLQLPPSVFLLVFISGLGFKIGPRQQKLWRTPNLSSLANPAVCRQVLIKWASTSNFCWLSRVGWANWLQLVKCLYTIVNLSCEPVLPDVNYGVYGATGGFLLVLK